MAVSPSIWKAMMMMYCQCNMVNTWWDLYSIQIWMTWCRLVVFSGYWRFTVSCSFQITQSFRGLSFSPFLWPKAARDAHFEQTSALFRWGGGILKYFISLLNWESYAGPTWKHLDRLGKFLVGERSIDQMKQIPRIQGILHQLKLVALKKLNPAQSIGFMTRRWWRWSIIKAFVLSSCISPHFVGDILYFGSAPITLFCWQNKRKRSSWCF